MLKNLLLSALVFLMVGNVAEVHAAGDAAAGKEKSAVCAACHGVEGISSIPMNPNLAGQVPGYIASQLAAYKSGDRANAVMAGQASLLSDQDMADLDAYFSSLQPNFQAQLSEEDQLLAEAGERLYRGGYADRGISACMGCHGLSGHGIPTVYPRVSAQHKEYLEHELLAFKKGERKGHNEIMSSIAFMLSEQQIKELAAYMAGLN